VSHGNPALRRRFDNVTTPSDLFILRGVPERLRSDNGPEFVAKAVQDWIAAVGAKAAYIAPGSLWENGFIEIRFIPASAARPFRRNGRQR
jgi:transposase InsO family protein